MSLNNNKHSLRVRMVKMVKVALKAVSSKYVLEIARVSEKGKKFFVVTNKKLNSTGRGKSGETPFSDFVQAFNAFNKKLKQRLS